MTDGILPNAAHMRPARAPLHRAAREFARARRHSRFVSVLKLVLPSVAALMVLAGIGAGFLARSLPGDVAISGLTFEDNRFVMRDPRLSGSDSADRPYSMTAARALPWMTGGGVDLEGIEAEIAVDDETSATIRAAIGRYDTRAERLNLSDDIAVDTTSGISIRMPEASIDLAAGLLEGRGPISIETPSQRLESGSVSIADEGRRITFGDRVRLTLLPDGSGQPASD